MNVPKSPCLFCSERELGCHITCAKYKKYEKARDEFNKHVSEEKNLDSIFEEMEIKRMRGRS